MSAQKDAFRREQEALRKNALAEAENKHLLELSQKDQQILQLRAKIAEAETVRELAVTQAVRVLDKENGELKAVTAKGRDIRITDAQGEKLILAESLKTAGRSSLFSSSVLTS